MASSIDKSDRRLLIEAIAAWALVALMFAWMLSGWNP